MTVQTKKKVKAQSQAKPPVPGSCIKPNSRNQVVLGCDGSAAVVDELDFKLGTAEGMLCDTTMEPLRLLDGSSMLLEHSVNLNLRDFL